MRKIIVDNKEIIVDDPEDRHKSRNVASWVVGKNKAREEKLAKRRKK